MVDQFADLDLGESIRSGQVSVAAQFRAHAEGALTRELDEASGLLDREDEKLVFPQGRQHARQAVLEQGPLARDASFRPR